MTRDSALILGDCLEVMPKLPSNCVNLVVCDPPYGTTLNSWDTIIPFDSLWENYKRLLNPSGTIVIFGCQPFTSALIMSNPKWFKQSLVWDKNKCGSPALANIRPMQTHEDIVIFAPGKTVYNPQMEVGEPYARKSSNPEGYVGRCNNHKYGTKPRTEFVNQGTRFPKSIVRISRDFSAQQQVHPTQKPAPLLEWLINTYSNPGDIVLDNCMGSGTTGVAAIRGRRRFIGIENVPGYMEIAHSRIDAEIARVKNESSP